MCVSGIVHSMLCDVGAFGWVLLVVCFWLSAFGCFWLSAFGCVLLVGCFWYSTRMCVRSRQWVLCDVGGGNRSLYAV